MFCGNEPGLAELAVFTARGALARGAAPPEKTGNMRAVPTKGAPPLSNVEALSPAVRASGEETFDMVVPAMKVEDFNFTEVTRF